MRHGSRWALKNGYASENDLLAQKRTVAWKGQTLARSVTRAKARGLEQIGSMGAGNHFVEVDVVESDPGSRKPPPFWITAGLPGCPDPLRLARTRSPGLHRLCAGFPICVKRYGIRTSRPGTGVCTNGQPGRRGLSRRDACGCQFCICQPAVAGSFRPACIRRNICRKAEKLAIDPGLRYLP